VVVGAGVAWAGIAAAREIQRHNDEAAPADKISYIVLEASDDTGGRARAAHWVVGCEGNPIAEFAWDKFSSIKNDVNYLQIDEQDWSDTEFYDIDGKQMNWRTVHRYGRFLGGRILGRGQDRSAGWILGPPRRFRRRFPRRFRLRFRRLRDASVCAKLSNWDQNGHES
jgi:hypothetical protein